MTNDQIESLRFLVVDDEEFSRELVVGVLNNVGAKLVYSAHDSQTAISLVRQHRPDFVLLDIYMPEVDGWTFLKELRKEMPDVVVIMITGSGKPTDFKKALENAVDGYCIKPVSPTNMRRALSSARNRRLTI